MGFSGAGLPSLRITAAESGSFSCKSRVKAAIEGSLMKSSRTQPPSTALSAARMLMPT